MVNTIAIDDDGEILATVNPSEIVATQPWVSYAKPAKKSFLSKVIGFFSFGLQNNKDSFDQPPKVQGTEIILRNGLVIRISMNYLKYTAKYL